MSNKISLFKKIRAKFGTYTRQEQIVLSIMYLLLFLWAIYTLIPYVYCIMNTVKDIKQFNRDPMGFPNYLKWENYVLAFELEYRNTNLLEMLGNSIIFLCTYTFANLFASLLTAYTLARYEFKGKSLIYGLAITIQLIPLFGNTGAAYLLCDRLGLIDNIWMMWVTVFNGFDMNFLIMYSYFVNVDRTYAEAARMDGASQFTIFWRIMIPMIMPPILVMMLSCVMTYWNNYTTPLIYFPNNPTLTTGIFSMQKRVQYVEGGMTAFYAAICISMVFPVTFFLLTNKKTFSLDVQGGIKG